MLARAQHLYLYLIFKNNLACWGFGIHGLLQMGGMEAFYGFIMFCFFFTFETWSPNVSIVWEITATPFTCETPAVFCGLKDFTHLSISMRVTRWWLIFHFWVNIPLTLSRLTLQLACLYLVIIKSAYDISRACYLTHKQNKVWNHQFTIYHERYFWSGSSERVLLSTFNNIFHVFFCYTTIVASSKNVDL